MRKLICTFTSVLTFSGLALAQPTTQPIDNSTRPPERRPEFRGEGMGPRGDGTFRRGMGRLRGEVSNEEWADISVFVQEKFKHRWAMFKEKEAEGKTQLITDMKQRIADRYRMLMRVQATTPELYDSLLRQAELEDNVFGAVQAVRKATPEQKDAAMSALRAAVTELVKAGLDERGERLAEAERALARHKELYAKDLAERDELIDAQVERFLSENPFRGPPDVPPYGTGVRPVREGPHEGEGPRDRPRDGERRGPRDGAPEDGPDRPDNRPSDRPQDRPPPPPGQ